MGKYLTTNQYKRYSDGVSLADVTDLTLSGTIARAEAGIDAHMGFDIKRGGFEPHEIQIQQAYDEKTRKIFNVHYDIPVRNVTRYRIQVSNLTGTGAGFFANINVNDAVINNDDGYIEIVPLQAVTYALSPVIMQLGLKPAIVEVEANVGYYIPAFGVPLFSDGKGKTYYAPHGYWATTYTQNIALQPNTLPPVPPNVYINGVLQLSSTYTFDATEGSVTFNSTQSPTAVVTADYTKQIPDYVAEATVLQTTYLLTKRALNKIGMYNQLYQIRTESQMMSFPQFIPVTAQGRLTPTALCSEAAAILGRADMWGIA